MSQSRDQSTTEDLIGSDGKLRSRYGIFSRPPNAAAHENIKMLLFKNKMQSRAINPKLVEDGRRAEEEEMSAIVRRKEANYTGLYITRIVLMYIMVLW